MNDVRDAIDRIGEQMSPTMRGLEALSRRRDRTRTRRRIGTVVFAIAVAVGGSALAASAFLVARSQPSPTAPIGVSSSTSSPGASDCPEPTGDDPPAVILSTSSGSAGSAVRITGTFRSSDRWIQLWWNAENEMPRTVAPPPWPSTGPDLQLRAARPGPQIELGSLPGPSEGGSCSFRFGFTVPDVPPGTYRLVAITGVVNEPPAYALFSSSLTFEVTA